MKDYFKYDTKICVVTGAASGIGKATAQLLVELNAEVYMIDRNEISLEGAKFIQADLSNKDSIDAAFKQIPKKIDTFFGVAGLSGVTTNYYTTFTVNYIANKYITEQFLKSRMSEGGAITYVSSAGGLHWEKYRKEFKKFTDATTWEEMTNALHSQAKPDTIGMMAYPLSKRAINYYCAKTAIELGEKGIRVNSLLPGSTDTGMKKEFAAEAGGMDELVSHAGAAKRLSTPEEIAMPLVFLNSDMAGFISGEMLVIDYASTAMKTLGIVKDSTNRKVGLKLYNSKLVQSALKKHLEQ